MFCPNCGARNSEVDTTCQKCGFNLKEAAGAKFKGTMLMMNNPAAADLRRSVAPGGVAPGGVPPGGAPAAGGAKPQAPTGAAEAQLMRAKLKGTMIGVAPPAAALSQPLPTATPATRQPSAPAGTSQPGPGQVNAPGAGLQRGGTMIGTGIGNPYPSPGNYGAPAQPAPPATYAPTEPLSATAPSQPSPSAPPGFTSTYGGAPLQGPAPIGATTVRSAAEPHPLAQTQVAAGAQEPYHSPAAAPQVTTGYPESAATRAMSQFDQPPPQRPLNTLDGTMVAAGGVPTAPRTDSMPQVGPQFSAQAGSRTDTPPMGFPAATGQSYSPGSAAGQSKGKTVLLTVITCGLYQLFKKAK